MTGKTSIQIKGKEGLPQVLEWSPLQFMERFAAIIPPPRGCARLAQP